MAREVSRDLGELQKFIKSYSIASLLDKQEYNTHLSQIHKKYYSYLAIITELEKVYKDESIDLAEIQMLYLKESCSDIGSAFFDTFHGMYKSASFLLRSSIETFIKGFCSNELPNLLTERKVTKIFDEVANMPFFKAVDKKEIFENIHRIYVHLCADVHTASATNMGNISSLSFFPKYALPEARNINKLIRQLSESYITLIALKYNAFYHQIHYINRQAIIDSIPSKYRKAINNIE